MRGGLPGLPWWRDLDGGPRPRLLSARGERECRREGEERGEREGDVALCANACLLARALWKDGYPLYESGAEALEKMTAGQIAHFAGLWAEFDRECDPGPWDGEAADEAKKDWSTRLMSAFSGVCSRLLALFRRRSGRGR